MKQNDKIIKHLRATKGLTGREALIDYSIQSFTKRISELRKDGWNIKGIKGNHPVTNQRYTRYVLVEATVTKEEKTGYLRKWYQANKEAVKAEQELLGPKLLKKYRDYHAAK